MSYPEYLQLKSIDELKNLPEKKIYFLAGGTDLLNSLRDGLIDTKNSCFVDLSKIKELVFINETDENVEIGSMISFYALQEHNLIRKYFPTIISMCKTFATPIISCRATIGGNIANASPSGDIIPVLYTLKTKLEIKNKFNVRTENIENIFVGPKKTNLQNGDLITKIIIPKPPIQNNVIVKGIFKKVGGRKAHIISKASVAITTIVKNDFVEEMNLAVGAVAPTVINVNKISEIMKNQKITKKLLDLCIKEIQNLISPIDDFRSTAVYRREVITALFLESMSEIFKTNFYD